MIIGGGPTGVELAGALAEISRQALSREFQHIDPSHARIILIEGVPRVLPPYPDDPLRQGPDAARAPGRGRLDRRARHRHRRRRRHLGHERILARTVLWAAGVAASPLANSLGVPLDRAGRVRVDPTLAVPGHGTTSS